MKLSKKLILSLLVVALVTVMGCKKKKEDPIIPAQKTAEALAAGQWTPSTGGISLDGTVRDEWTNFRITFSANAANKFENGTYSATGLPTEANAQLVWKASGTWAFKPDSNYRTIIRDDNVEISVTVDVNETGDDGTLSLAFEVQEPVARVDGFFGNWIFQFGL